MPQCRSEHGDEKKDSSSKHLPVSERRELGVIQTYSRSHNKMEKNGMRFVAQMYSKKLKECVKYGVHPKSINRS